ncbi:hypothetical protein SAMN02745166_03089 [Prosthecobacter debontii]|uniref:Uncharacterized protein n=1 Tax=Prosthecobacter debontii TaxID=48467 RepID=A0A1T4YEI9_9BACT|nr:hypothetical protein [Prosthecobacter debontii]SKB00189.1 hypothetical protein SAMN02745166_03089 [Prosthecobacter debontii]
MKKRAAKKPEFYEGKEAAQRFESLLDTVLTVPKDKILELEKGARKKSGAEKKNRKEGAD